uniref:Uncharacterized protein n=1 Tax=Caenorhabditis japonica TaxID=281687 RepID=A0A8R1I6J3_CAEJA
MDAIQSYLPPHLIPQEASLDDLFVHSLPYQDPVEVVWRRRENYKQAGDLVKDALSLSLRALRSYHWEMDKDVLRPCSDCKDSSNHLKWEQVKTHRAKCRKIGTDPDDWTPKDLMQQ